MALNNTINWQWLIETGRIQEAAPGDDYIIVGSFDTTSKTKSTASRTREYLIKVEDFYAAVSGDANNQLLTIEGEGDELVLSNGTLNGAPIPDSVIDMNDFTPLYDNHAPTKSGKVAPGAFTGALLKEATITFGSAFTNANYTPVVTIQSPDNYSVSVKNITASSFTICLNSVVVPTVDVYWSAVKHGEY